jgi:hypothetical protein
VRDIVDTQGDGTFAAGILIGLFAMSAHLANIIVAGRGAALASQHSIDPDKNEDHNVTYFRFYLSLCEQLQFLATILFVISIAILIFVMFSSVAYPIVVIWWSVLLALAVFCLGYWKLSMTSKNLKYLMSVGGKGWQSFKVGMWGR